MNTKPRSQRNNLSSTLHIFSSSLAHLLKVEVSRDVGDMQKNKWTYEWIQEQQGGVCLSVSSRKLLSRGCKEYTPIIINPTYLCNLCFECLGLMSGAPHQSAAWRMLHVCLPSWWDRPTTGRFLGAPNSPTQIGRCCMDHPDHDDHVGSYIEQAIYIYIYIIYIYRWYNL